LFGWFVAHFLRSHLCEHVLMSDMSQVFRPKRGRRVVVLG
jgi:hypothetical protein